MSVTGADIGSGLHSGLCSDAVDSDLVDVTGLVLGELDDLPDTVLGDLLRRLVADAVAPGAEPVAAFQSAL